VRNCSRFRDVCLLYILSANSCAWGQAVPASSQQQDGALNAKAIALYQRSDLIHACPLFQQLAVRQPKDPEIHLYLLGCAIRHRNTQAVDQQILTLNRLASAPSKITTFAADWLVAGGFCQTAEKEYSLAPSEKEAGAVEYALGQCYQATGNHASAIEQYRRALELDPTKEEHYLSPASLLIADNQFEETGKILTDGLQRFPNSLRLRVAMGLLRLDVGYPDEARVEYEEARALSPESPIVWKLLGLIQRSEGDFPSAVKSFERAAAIDGTDAQTYLLMGLAQERIEDGGDAALADFLHALQIAPGLVEARYEAASIYLQSTEDPKRAVEALRKVITDAPNYARAYRLLAQAYQRLGQTEKADAAASRYHQLTGTAPAQTPQRP
jgi:tetratricopeptide (TPR) repeat protein